MKRIYLAGPDVFFADAAERAKLHKQLVRDFGFKNPCIRLTRKK